MSFSQYEEDPTEIYASEIQSFRQVWLVAMASLLYCYFVAARIPAGFSRLLSLVPIIYLFTTLPFSLSASFHLAAPTVFYLVWLGNFKLLLFSFNQGPLSSPSASLLQFIAVGLLPIKPTTGPSPSSSKNTNTRILNVASLFVFAIKLALLVIIICIYDYRENLPRSVIMALYCCHLYLGVELFLAVTAVPVRLILGMEIEAQFNEPYLATSLQDFWGRRWNLMVTSILRPTVYNPVRAVFAPVLGRNWSLAAAIVATFLVSGLMHEVIYYYISRARRTWEVTWFFILHGFCVAAEIGVKKWSDYRLHRAVSGPLTIGFVGVTGAWLFFPQILRYEMDLKAIKEYYDLIHFVREKLGLGTTHSLHG